MNDLVALAGRPRWRGQPGRLEVHYLTAKDAASGTGLWLHHEVVAPTSGEPAYAHGWIATFPVAGSPTCMRFGPAPVASATDDTWFAMPDVVMTATAASGAAEGCDWQLRWTADARPLWTFPQWAWRRQALPAAQVLPTPRTTISGRIGAQPFSGDGAVAHIYGHGNAERWVWLHADLGDDAVLEVVAATARRAGLRRLPPLPLLQLRVGGQDWPRDPLAAAPLLRARIRADGFTIRGTVGTRRIRVAVELPPPRCVSLRYADPDGATATCTNTERADVSVEVADLTARGWRRRNRWQLDGTGHAEIGTRP